jgi:hypothetical protein
MRRLLPSGLPTAAVVALLATGCSDGAPPAQAEPAKLPSASPAKAAPAAAPAAATEPAANPPPWSDPVALAAGISSTHYVPAITSGEPYSVTDPVTQTRYELDGPDLIEDEHGKPLAFATGPAAGHALAAAEAASGVKLVLDYALAWNKDAPTMSGKPGVFQVTGVEIHQVGDGPPRHEYVRDGELWVRKPAK